MDGFDFKYVMIVVDYFKILCWRICLMYFICQTLKAVGGTNANLIWFTAWVWSLYNLKKVMFVGEFFFKIVDDILFDVACVWKQDLCSILKYIHQLYINLLSETDLPWLAV